MPGRNIVKDREAGSPRGFAFVKMWPSMQVVKELGCPLMQEAFQRLLSIFVEHTSDEAFNLNILGSADNAKGGAGDVTQHSDDRQREDRTHQTCARFDGLNAFGELYKTSDFAAF